MKKIILSEKNYDRVMKFGEGVDRVTPFVLKLFKWTIRLTAIYLMGKGFCALSFENQVILFSVVYLLLFYISIITDYKNRTNETYEWGEPYVE